MAFKLPVLIAVSVVGCAAAAAAQTAAPVATFEPYALRTFDGQLHNIELGKLTVPQLRTRPTGPTLSVAFLRLKSTNAKPGSPIVFLMGGPGIASSVMAPIPPYWQLFDTLRTVADVILLDQRGLGLSSPRVDCPALPQPLDTAFLRSHASFVAGYRSVLANCANHWREKGVDARAFSDAESADDIEDIRRAIGAPQVSLLGFSYGTRLAMTFVRRHPGRVERMVLQGPTDADLEHHAPLSFDTLFVRMAALAAADSASAPFSQNLVARTIALFERADRTPTAVKIKRTAGDSVTIPLGGDVVRGLVSLHVADVRLPAFIATTERGDYAILTRWVESLYNDFNAGAGTLMARGVTCSAGPSDARREEVDAQAKLSMFGASFDNFAADANFCSALGGESPPMESRRRVRVAVPTLFITGELDDRTPIGNDELLGREFANTVHIRVPNGGHELLPDRAVRGLVVDFLLDYEVRDRVVKQGAPRFLGIEAAKRPPRRPGQ